MKRILLLVAAFMPLLSLHAQIKPQGTPDASKHPEVTFQVNLRDPEVLSEKDFKLIEDTAEVKFAVTNLDSARETPKNNILILWEYLPSADRNVQNEHFRKALLATLGEDLLTKEDQINIATFAWTKGDSILNLLTEGMTNDVDDLFEKVETAKAPNGKGIKQDHGSELYPAIVAGVKYLSNYKDGARTLIVLSAEFPNIYNAATENAANAIGAAKQADVAIYPIRYKQMGDKYSLRDVAAATFGLSEDAVKDSPEGTSETIRHFTQESAIRSLGQDYQFAFTTAAEKDGKAHSIRLERGTDNTDITYNAPSKTAIELAKENPIWVVVILIVVIGGVVAIVFFQKKQKEKRAQEAEKEQQRLAEIEKANQDANQKMKAQQQELDKMKAAGQAKEQAERKSIAEAEAKALYAEMFSNGKNPRLLINANGSAETVVLPSAVTTLGRAPENDIVVASNTVSRNHFQIIYQGGKYFLVDLGSTNGTVLNGVKVTREELRHGDVISVSGVTFHFYV